MLHLDTHVLLDDNDLYSNTIGELILFFTENFEIDFI